jgi:hypothetical protein
VSIRDVEFGPSVRYLLGSDEWTRTVVIGGLATLFGFLVVPAVLVAGYLVRVLQAATNEHEEPPTFDDPRVLATVGLRASAVVAAYGLAFLLVSAVILAVVGNVDAGSGLTAADALVLALVALNVAVGLVTAYVVPAAVANLAERGTIRAGFAVGDLRSVLASRAYLRTWLAADVVLVVTAAVVAAVGVVPLLGAVAAGFVWFYGATVACHLLGGGWREARLASTTADAAGPGGDGWLPSRPEGVPAVGGVARAVRERLPAGETGADASADPLAGGRERDPRVEPAADRVARTGHDASVAAVADRPTAALDADDVAALVAGLDADDPSTVATAARALGDAADERPDLVADSGARPRLRDLRLADDRAVRRAATRAVRRLSEAGLY